MNVNLETFYCLLYILRQFGNETSSHPYCSIVFENNAPPTLHPTLNLTDSFNKTNCEIKNPLAAATMLFLLTSTSFENLLSCLVSRDLCLQIMYNHTRCHDPAQDLPLISHTRSLSQHMDIALHPELHSPAGTAFANHTISQSHLQLINIHTCTTFTDLNKNHSSTVYSSSSSS